MDENQKQIHEMISGIRFAMFTTREGERLVSRPMTPLRIDEDMTIHFITQRSTDVAQQADGQQVNLAFVDGGTFVSVSGPARLSDDLELKKELWNVPTDAYTEGGPEDPENVVLIVDPESASYWDSAAAPVALWGIVKSRVTGDKPAYGDHGTVEV